MSQAASFSSPPAREGLTSRANLPANQRKGGEETPGERKRITLRKRPDASLPGGEVSKVKLTKGTIRAGTSSRQNSHRRAASAIRRNAGQRIGEDERMGEFAHGLPAPS
jgi:hypothetical protein